MRPYRRPASTPFQPALRRTLAPLTLLAAALAPLGSAQAQDQQINIICSVQAEWCNMIQTVYARTTGVKVNMSM